MHIAASTSSDLLTMGIPVAEKALRTVGVYVGLVVLLRLGGKRDLAQLNSFDLVVLLLLSNDVQNAIIGNDNSLSGGLLGATVLVAVNGVVVRLARRSKAAVTLFEGTSTVIVRDGQVDDKALHHLGMRREDVIAAVRRQGANKLDEVEVASIEAGGSVVVKLRPDQEIVKLADLAPLERRLELIAQAVGAQA